MRRETSADDGWYECLGFMMCQSSEKTNGRCYKQVHRQPFLSMASLRFIVSENFRFSIDIKLCGNHCIKLALNWAVKLTDEINNVTVSVSVLCPYLIFCHHHYKKYQKSLLTEQNVWAKLLVSNKLHQELSLDIMLRIYQLYLTPTYLNNALEFLLVTEHSWKVL